MLPYAVKMVKRAQALIRHKPFRDAIKEARQRFSVKEHIYNPARDQPEGGVGNCVYFTPENQSVDLAGWYPALRDLAQGFFPPAVFGCAIDGRHPAYRFLSAAIVFSHASPGFNEHIQRWFADAFEGRELDHRVHHQGELQFEGTRLWVKYLEDKLKSVGVDPNAEAFKDGTLEKVGRLNRQAMYPERVFIEITPYTTQDDFLKCWSSQMEGLQRDMLAELKEVGLDGITSEPLQANQKRDAYLLEKREANPHFSDRELMLSANLNFPHLPELQTSEAVRSAIVRERARRGMPPLPKRKPGPKGNRT